MEQQYARGPVLTDDEPRSGFPLSSAQRGIWFAQHLLGDIPLTIAQYIDVHGDLDVEAFADAGAATGRELGTAMLRLFEHDGQPYQVIDPDLNDRATVLDLRDRPDPEAAALAWMHAEYRTPLDMLEDRLIVCAILRIADARYFVYTRIHHVALDGFGATTFANRTAERYNAAKEGREPAPFAVNALHEIVEDENRYRESSRFESDRAYWADRVHDLPHPIGLSGRAAPVGPHPVRYGAPLPDDVSASVERVVARDEQATFASLVVAAFAAFLARVTGESDVVLSLPVSARTTVKLRRSGGMVSNVVPIRVAVDPEDTTRDLTTRVQVELTGALRHQRYRHEDMRRDTGRGGADRGFFGPAVNIMMFGTEIRLGDLVGRLHVLSTGPVEDLSLNIYPSEPGRPARLDLEANPNLYSPDELRSHHSRFTEFLADFVRCDGMVGTIDVLHDDERDTLVPFRGRPARPVRLLPDLLAEGVRRNRDGVAVLDGDRTLTYRDLDERSDRFARVLADAGAAPETFVVLSMERSAEALIALWAVAKSGAAFVPIDPALPAERLAYMIRDSGARLAVTTRDRMAGLPAGPRLLAVDDEHPAVESPPVVKARPEHPAYMIYTSGSTGTPKGVVVTHAGLATFEADARPELGLTPSSRMLRFSSASFDASIFEMLQAFSAGAAMVIAPPDILGGDDLALLLRSRRVTHIVSAPTVLTTVDPAGLDALEAVVVGGDVCTPDLVERFGVVSRFTNSYGPTETTIVVTAGTPLEPGDPVTIGRPLDGVVAVVLDRRLRPVPVGFVGELYIGGPALARGYHRRPGQTADRFVANPFEPGGRLYRTGDDVRWTADHQLEFLGRSDFQVKIRGFRIELGEIDAALLEQTGVDYAASVVHDTGSSSVPISYVRMEPGHRFDAAALLDGVGRMLPSHMVPAAMMELDHIPVTPAGKLDRAALPAPRFASAEFRAPETESEIALAELAVGLLDVELVGVDDSLFALGADSIVAMQFAARAKDIGLHLTARQIFEHRTIAALARVATSVAATPVMTELPGGGTGEIPLTPIVHEMLGRGDFSTFAQAVLVTTPADLTARQLSAALGALLARHDMLRSALRDETWEVAADAVDPDTLVTRVPVARVEDIDDLITSRCDSAAAALDPRAGVMLAAVWFDVEAPDAKGKLLLVAHHLVVDGVSWRVLLPDLAQAWMQVVAAREPALPEVGTSFRRWAHALHDATRDGAFAGELGYWQRTLAGVRPLRGVAPLDPALDTLATTRRVRVEIDPVVTEAVLTRLPALYRSGTADGLLTALALAAARWDGDAGDSLLLTLEGHGRDPDAIGPADLARTVGWFTSAYPVRLSVSGDLHDTPPGGSDVGAAIKAVKEQLAAVPNHGVGYGVLRHLDHESGRVLAQLPGAQLSFNYLGRLTSGHIPDEIRDIGWVPDDVDLDPNRTSALAAASAIDINAMVVDGADGPHLTATFAYVPRVVSAERVEEFAELWLDALTGLATHVGHADAGGLTPSDVPLVVVRQRQIEQWESQYPGVHDIWPLPPLQAGLLFHTRLAAGSLDVYVAQLSLELAGAVDSDRLRAAVDAVVARHANLRTAFVHDETGDPVQIVLDRVEVPWREVHADERSAVLDAERAAPFDPARPPLLRAVLVRTGHDRATLVLTNHHLVLDGWSMPLLVREVLTHYLSRDALPDPVPYRDYLRWWHAQDEHRSLQAWAGLLEGVTEPTLVAPNAGDSFEDNPGEIGVELTAPLLTALTARARDTGVTVNTMVQVAWSLVLGRLLSRSDVVFGATVSGRPAELPGVENMLGLFINTVPVRVRLQPEDTVADLLRSVQDTQVSMLDHHHVGLGRIQHAVGAGTLFDTLTVFESYPVDRAGFDETTDFAGMRVTGIDARDATHYPLTVMAILEPQLRLSVRYRTDLFDSATVDRLTQRLVGVLDTVATSPETRIGDVDVFLPGERDTVAGFERGAVRALPMSTLADLLTRQARRTPDAEAVLVDGGSTLRYAEFAPGVNRVARALVADGIGPGDLVGVAMPRSLDQLIAIHAVVTAGAAYVPIDPDQPAARTAHVLETAAPVRVLHALPDVSGLSGAPITDRDRRAPLRPDDLAYVLFTSGSTGRPKGVAISHRSIVNRLLWMQDTYPLTGDDVVLQKTPATFDVSVWELFWPLLTGASVVLASPDGHRDPRYLSRVIDEYRITTLHFVPSMLDVFLTGADLTRCGSVRQVFTSGEALPATTVARFADALGAPLHNLYGPTEAAVDVTAHETVPGENPVPIGTPVWNTTVRVLDSRLRPVPVGVEGELYLGGVQLARGYHAAPGLTAARFVADPSGGARLYRTGDVVRWRVDGVLEYVGRSDFQVKLRGQRIELGEIESALLEHDDVTQAVVVLHRDTVAGEHLVAYVVGTLDSEAVLRHAATRLPRHMVPTVVMVLDALPLTANGKLDRKSLPAPEFGSGIEYVAPATATEKTVSTIVADVLGRDRPGATANFFDLGGNSLTATRLLARLDDTFGTRLQIRDLFDNATVSGLSALIDGQQDRQVGPALVAGPRPERIPLSPAQARMWFVNRFDPASGAYNVAVALRLTGTLDVDALRNAVTDIVGRHETLRTRYPDDGDGPRQEILPVASAVDALTLTVEDLTGTLDEWLVEVVGRGFDVTREIPLALNVVREDADRHVVALVVHHIAIDGWSMQALARDLVAAYGARSAGAAPAWEPLPVGYADYALWQHGLLGGIDDPESVAAAQLAFWRETLAGAPDLLDLPTDRRRPSVPSFRGGTVTVDVPTAVYTACTELARAHEASLFMVLHTALAVLLARTSGTYDVTVGTPVAGRGHRALDDVVGMFVNTLPLRTRFDASLSFAAALTVVRDNDLAAYSHADLPFEQLAEALATTRSTSHQPLFQTVLALDVPQPRSVTLPELEIEVLPVDFGIAKFDLEFAVTEHERHATVTLTFARDLFEESTAAMLADRFVRVLESAVADPDASIGTLDLLSHDEHDELLRRPEFVDARTLPQLLAAAVTDSEVPALVSGTRVVTYGELDRRSAALAHMLIEAGAGPETVVAVAVERSVESVLAVWAVARTGAAFLPVDPTYPAARIEHMLTDSGARLGLTTDAHRNALPDDVRWLDATAQTDDDLPVPARVPHLDQPAYLIYTSGSTGVPKGVVVTHRGLAAFVAEQQRHYGVRPGDRVAAFASPSFDASLLELLMAVGGRATLVLVPTGIYGGTELETVLADTGVTHLFLTPAALATVDPETLPHVRVVVVGGEACEPSLVARWAPGRAMFNAYGPTESTIMATHFGPMVPGEPVRIGRAVIGTSVLVLDDRLQPVPTGVPGELYVSGAGLARGYHARPALTASRFVADPISGGVVYRTGDRVRKNAGGTLDFLGRNDFQVKVRGHRIELSEIDAVLSAHPSVEAVVSVPHDESGAVVAYVVAAPGLVVDAADVAAHAARTLPDYMVPAAITVVDALPLTGAGKVDLRALPEPVFTAAEFVAPRTEAERRVAGAFADVLGLERVGAHDDFFALGGNSLSATRVVARLDASAGVRAVFENPTVASLAAVVGDSASEQRPPLVSGPRPDHLPLSPAQQRMWLINRFDPTSPAYNIPVAVRLRGRLDHDALCAAAHDVVQRHEVLRTVFPDADADADGPAQVIRDDAAVDLSPRPVTADTLGDEMLALVSRGFDLTTDTPIRGALLRIADEDHVLVVVVHHIAADGASTVPLARDIFVAYGARLAGDSPSWVPLAVQYADFALWQRGVLGDPGDPGSLAACQLAYWTEALADVPAVLDLPADRSRPAVASQRGARVDFRIGAGTVRALDELARSHGATRFMALHAALSVLLARLGNTDDVCVGTPVAGRGDAALDDVVGMFVNTLVLRTRFDPTDGFGQVLERTRDTDLAAFGHADVPFEQVVDAVGPVRSQSHAPLFQVSLSLQNQGTGVLELPGLRIEPVEPGVDVAKVDLEFTVRDDDGGALAASLTYATDLFDAGTAESFTQRWVRVLDAVTANPAGPVGDVSLSTEDEARSALEHAVPADMPAFTLPEILAAGVAANPDGVAVTDGTRHLTYTELDRASNRLARKLADLGARTETFVALSFPRCVDGIVALWAVAKTGAAFVPVDPGLPAARIAYLLSDSGVRLGLAHGDGPSADIPWVRVDDAGGYSDAPIAHDRSPVAQSAAYMIYTSGSTGTPKGVVVTHRGLTAFTAEHRPELGVSTKSRVLRFSSSSFDASVFEQIAAFSAGATMVVAAPEVVGGAELADLLRRERVTHVLTAPAALGTVTPTDLPDLEAVMVGGDVCPPELVAKFGPVCRFFNSYGPTETTIIITEAGPMSPGDDITIGVPIHGSGAVILDDRLHPVPDGVVGELYLSGAGLARGYHRRPELTAARFVACPYTGGLMYRTGDLVRRTATGEIRFVGRRDAQVQLRGLRIELDEIEAVLTSTDSVAQAVVVVHTDAHTGDRLVGYVVPTAGTTADPRTLRDRIGAELPSYMVPAQILVLDALPITANGKLDRKALPVPGFEARAFRAPENPVQQTVAGVYAELLGIDRVGLDDDFFALGGNSLIATQLAARLGSALDTTVPVRAVFEAPTVVALAAAVASTAGAGARPALTARERPARIPLSLAQQRLWFLNRFDPDSATYNIPAVLRVSGRLDTTALQAAVEDVLARHEVLRTVYPEVDGEGIQQVLASSAVVADLTPVPVGADDVLAVVAEFVSAGFDVTAEVPVRVRLYRPAPEDFVLVFVVHHIAADGFSMGPLTRDVMTAYASRVRGNPPGWAPLPLQYADYSLWQRTVLGSEDDPGSVMAEQIDFWTETLASLPDQLELPWDRPRPQVVSHRGASHAVTLDGTLHAGLLTMAGAHRATLFMVLHSATAVALSRLSGSSDIALGTPVAGRGDAALDDLVGMFVNTLVLRTAVDAGSTFTDLLRSVREVDLRAFAHAEVPFERLVEVLAPPRSQARNPLFQVMLTLQNMPAGEFRLGDVGIEPVDPPLDRAMFDLQITAHESFSETGEPSGISMTWTYATDLFDDATVVAIADRVVRILDAVVHAPATPVGDLDWLAPDEHSVLRALGLPTVRTHGGFGTLPERLDAQAERSPDAVAVTDGTVSYSYAEFASRVNRLARHLVSLGVGPDANVAVVMERSIDAVVAVHAVVAAGGAYVPLDPGQPAERTSYVLDTADPVLVLSSVHRDAYGDRTVVDLGVVDLSGVSDAPIGDHERRAPLRADNAAYVLFTSGSTGRPKGVTVSHAAVVNQLSWLQEEFLADGGDTVLLKTPLTFDASVWELFWPLHTGARLAVAAPDGHRDPEYLARALVDFEVTVAQFVPTVLDAVLDVAEAPASSLRLVFTGGEALSGTTAQRVRTRFGCDVHNLYGPTETAMQATHHPGSSVDGGTAVPIGTPVWNTGAWVLDTRLHPVPVGVVGELYLSGAQLARGYAGRAALTAGRFVANPFDAPGTRLYRTGDLVRRNRRGELEFVGRNDLQVKLRGQRIELGEIESVLRANGRVAAGAVVAWPDQLVGYVVPAGEPDVQQLRAEMGKSLPSYMVPSQFVVLEAMPTTPNGKLDRKALPQPEIRAHDFRAPSTDTENAVAEAFSSILGIGQVGLDDDFFALGGTSLVATRFVARIRDALGVAVPLQWLFSHSTVEALSLQIDRGDTPGPEFAVLQPLREQGDLTPLFCVHPIVGLSWCYTALVPHLDPSLPVYGLQTPLDDLPDSLEDLAARYVDEIRRVQGRGPYRLLGWSMGGVIAQEMAVQLQAAGDTVASLVMLDSFADTEFGTATGGIDEMVPMGDLLAGFGLETDGNEPGTVDDLVRVVADLTGNTVHDTDRLVRKLRAAAEHNAASAARHRPSRFDGDLLYFSAGEDGRGGATGWADAVSGQVRERSVPVTHWRMTSPEALAVVGPVLRTVFASPSDDDRQGQFAR
ncbi:non-ribosomal peptide synthase/polyketide synthase [Rhodococcus coprophilus]|uniref:Non-ribosomal peptide synthetase n=1 Tax=Rhodococcus coprophilus TaxID=38310 RepID=A0A2X4X8X4_9NOCA|nr:non-ribosomal peptide synthetase [Rhodococcus coprophilus]MBM7459468.1 amino acid adenylation domain-containing protein/non-ribosomal peptide synthase protein (TIGR01720 family) [Rhodococcus coprophilus]SQI36145.1 non-ribosomal peptide synthetase [Rhodococcus coprophilus]